jgi:hypothetical protein
MFSKKIKKNQLDNCIKIYLVYGLAEIHTGDPDSGSEIKDGLRGFHFICNETIRVITAFLKGSRRYLYQCANHITIWARFFKFLVPDPLTQKIPYCESGL